MKKHRRVIIRNPFAADALSRKAGLTPMKDRREPRKGAMNEQSEYLQDYCELCGNSGYNKHSDYCACEIGAELQQNQNEEDYQ